MTYWLADALASTDVERSYSRWEAHQRGYHDWIERRRTGRRRPRRRERRCRTAHDACCSLRYDNPISRDGTGAAWPEEAKMSTEAHGREKIVASYKDLTDLLQLPEGCEVSAVVVHPLTETVSFVFTGPGLTVQPPGCEPPIARHRLRITRWVTA